MADCLLLEPKSSPEGRDDAIPINSIAANRFESWWMMTNDKLITNNQIKLCNAMTNLTVTNVPSSHEPQWHARAGLPHKCSRLQSKIIYIYHG